MGSLAKQKHDFEKKGKDFSFRLFVILSSYGLRFVLDILL